MARDKLLHLVLAIKFIAARHDSIGILAHELYDVIGSVAVKSLLAALWTLLPSRENFQFPPHLIGDC